MEVPSLLRDGEQTYLYRHLQASQGPLLWAGQMTHLVSAAAHVTPLQPNHAVGLGMLWPHQLLPEMCGSRQPMHSSKWSGFGPLKREPRHWSSSLPLPAPGTRLALRLLYLEVKLLLLFFTDTSQNIPHSSEYQGMMQDCSLPFILISFL